MCRGPNEAKFWTPINGLPFVLSDETCHGNTSMEGKYFWLTTLPENPRNGPLQEPKMPSLFALVPCDLERQHNTYYCVLLLEVDHFPNAGTNY